jgi:hypothetical protein
MIVHKGFRLLPVITSLVLAFCANSALAFQESDRGLNDRGLKCDPKTSATEQPAAMAFIKETDLFLRRLAEQRVKHESKELTGQTLQSEKERVERESQALLRFYERNLAKCPLSKELGTAVSKRFQAIKNSTKAFAGLK